MSAYAFIALGSNAGDSKRLVTQAIHELEKLSRQPLLQSSLWRSDPVDCPPGSPPFINAVVGLVPMPNETPESLLRALQVLETQFGRQPKKVLNEPRPLDLDLIAFGALIRHTDFLTLPHPRAQARRFVLEPLAEIAPDLVLPGQSETVRRLLEKLGTNQKVSRIAP